MKKKILTPVCEKKSIFVQKNVIYCALYWNIEKRY